MSLYSRTCSLIKTWPFRGFRKIDGWLSDNEAHALYSMARKLPYGSTLVEIGSWQGKSTCCLAKGLAQGTIHAIDPFDASGESSSAELYQTKARQNQASLLDTFKKNLQANNVLGKIQIHQGYSSAFVGQFSQIDLLFIDGDHSIEGCLYDYEHFAHAVKPGGFLAFHDYHPDRKNLGPTHVVEQHVISSGKWTRHLRADSLIAFTRNA